VVVEPYYFLFGAMTKCLYHKKEETYLYKGFCLVWLESQEGIKGTGGKCQFMFILWKDALPRSKHSVRPFANKRSYPKNNLSEA